MAVESGVSRKGSWWIVWPFFVAGFGGPLLAGLLMRWMAFHFASGISALLTWFFFALIVGRRYPPRYPVWLVAILMGLAAGLAIGVLTYYFPLEITAS
jgi:MFS superfamily sulfate permease-like transporter